MLVTLESARSALFQAVRDADANSPSLAASAAAAKTVASEAYLWIAGENIHVHGGIGFTWEHPAHLYFKRAKSSEVLLGTPAFHRRRFARLQGLFP